MFRTMSLALGACAMCVTASVALADEALEKAVKARQSYYQVVSFNSGPLFAMMKGSLPYDAETAQTHADNLKTLSALKNGAMWPKGSSKDDLPGKTRALAAIWADGSTVGAKGAAYRKAVDELAEVAGKGRDEMVPKVRALGATCSACHKDYRAENF